jgi:hypothetical protein
MGIQNASHSPSSSSTASAGVPLAAPTEIAPKNYAAVVAGRPKPTETKPLKNLRFFGARNSGKSIYWIFRKCFLNPGGKISILLGGTFPPRPPSSTCRSGVRSQELAYQGRSFDHSVRSKARLHQALEQRCTKREVFD